MNEICVYFFILIWCLMIIKIKMDEKRIKIEYNRKNEKMIIKNIKFIGNKINEIYKENRKKQKLNLGKGWNIGIIKEKNNIVWIREINDSERWIEMSNYSGNFIENIDKKGDKISVYYPISIAADTQIMWQKFGKKQPRNLKNVYISEDLKCEIIGDLTSFFNNKSQYNDCGIPYRKGYLIYGPAGCGKSTLMTALATEFKTDIYWIGLGGYRLNDERLTRILNSVPPGKIIVIEGIDGIINDMNRQNLTLSGLLNALDGLTAHTEHPVIFLSNTEDPTKFPQNLMRKGRIDRVFKIDFPDKKVIEKLFTVFYEKHFDNQEILEKIAKKYAEKFDNNNKIPTCQIINDMLIFIDNPTKLIE